jgi:ABC-type phosphate transport system substrate-binding protein
MKGIGMKTFYPYLPPLRVGYHFSCIFIGVLFSLSPLEAQVAVIAHKSVLAGSVDNSSLLDVFTLNTKNWSDGGKITVIDFKNDSPARTKFYTALGTSFAEMQKTWLRKQFSGKALPPLLLASDDEIVSKVASTPGAIGYVSLDKVSKEVKVLATIK